MRAARILLLAAALGLAAFGARAEITERAAAIKAASEQTFDIALEVSMEGRRFVAVETKSSMTTLFEVRPSQLAESMQEALKPELFEQILALGDEFTPVGKIENLGLILSFDPGTLSIKAELAPELRSTDVHSFLRDERFKNYAKVAPTDYALGVTSAFIGRSGTNIDDFEDTFFDPTFLFDGFANAGGRNGLNADFSFDVRPTAENQSDVFIRNSATAFYDFEEEAIRASLGDVRPRVSGLSSTPDFVGVALERRFLDIQPMRSVEARGQRRLFLERESTVEIWVNGALISRFRAGPGEVDLRDIPFASSRNEVQVFVDDGTGRREVDRFDFASGFEMLQAGLLEFSFAGGALRDRLEDGLDFEGDVGGSGLLRYGLTNQLTLETFAQGDGTRLNFGGGAVFGTPIGLFDLDVSGAYDRDEDSVGAAAMLDFSTDFVGLFEERDEFNLSFEYRSDDFARFGEPLGEDDYNYGIDATYDTSFDDRSTASFGFHYQTDEEEIETELEGSVGLSRNIAGVTLSLLGSHDFENNESRAFATVSYSLGDRKTARAAYSSPNNTSRLELQRFSDQKVGDYGYGAALTKDDDGVGFLGTADTVGNRFAAEASVSIEDGDTDRTIGEVRFQSGIAITERGVAIGRDPARGFAIVQAHKSLDDAPVEIRTSSSPVPRARSDIFGDAVIDIERGYTPQFIDVEVAEAPIGYNLGEGRYLLDPGARSGFVVEVGRDDYFSALGTITRYGEAISLRTGKVVSLSDPDWTPRPLFTNRSGRFAVGDLKPGRYRISITGYAETLEFDFNEDSPPLVDIGIVDIGS